MLKMDSKPIKKDKDSAISKSLAALNRNTNSKRKNPRGFGRHKLPAGRGVIYVGHLPHGFYEDEMKSYFSQFGAVTATAVARSKKSGRSKGFGFVEFLDKEVAKIAAEAMNNYLMFSRIIKCKYLPYEERKRRVDPGRISTSEYPRQKNRITNAKNKRKAMEKLSQKTHLKTVQKKVEKFKKRFKDLGIEFTYKIGDGKLPEVKKEQSSDLPEVKTEEASKVPELKSEDDGEHQFGVLEIDESDDEISFKTPPKVKKIIKKSLNSSVKPSNPVSLKNSQTKKEAKMNQLKNKKSKQIGGKEKKRIQKSEMSLNKTKQKLDRQVKPKLNVSELTKAKGNSKSDIKAVIKQKNLQVQKSIGLQKNSKVKKSTGLQKNSKVKKTTGLQKNSKVKKSIGLKQAKKECSTQIESSKFKNKKANKKK